MESHSLQLLIIVPTYNEEDNINELLEKIGRAVPEAHILFVDDNSQDQTRQLIERQQSQRPEHIHLLKRPGKLGLGTAYVAGFRWALGRSYQVVCEMDADHSHNPAYLPEMLKLLDNFDVVVGSRYIPGGGTENWSFLRKFISRSGSLYARTILGIKVRDLTGGFNMWRRSVLENIDIDSLKSEGYAFQIELKYRASCHDYRISEFPIIFADRRAGQSKMSGRIVFEAMYRVWGLTKYKKRDQTIEEIRNAISKL